MPKGTVITNVTPDNTILSRQGAWQAATVRISSADITANADGKKIVPAGTILGSATAGSAILGGGAKAKPANDETAEGLAMNTVDATSGDIEVSMLFMGTVGLNRLPETPSEEARAALARITFTKD